VKRILFVGLLIVGCKQGKGERCQIDTDCQSPLTCNVATMACQGPTSGDVDARVPDAPKSINDAGVDATSDAASDAPRD
jgi:hypothetical protein